MLVDGYVSPHAHGAVNAEGTAQQPLALAPRGIIAIASLVDILEDFFATAEMGPAFVSEDSSPGRSSSTNFRPSAPGNTTQQANREELELDRVCATMASLVLSKPRIERLISILQRRSLVPIPD